MSSLFPKPCVHLLPPSPLPPFPVLRTSKTDVHLPLPSPWQLGDPLDADTQSHGAARAWFCAGLMASMWGPLLEQGSTCLLGESGLGTCQAGLADQTPPASHTLSNNSSSGPPWQVTKCLHPPNQEDAFKINPVFKKCNWLPAKKAGTYSSVKIKK